MPLRGTWGGKKMAFNALVAVRASHPERSDVLDAPLDMPSEKLRTLRSSVEARQDVTNLDSVVLGGSYTRGVARAESDIDIGLYYRGASPFRVDQIRSVAERICTPGSVPIVTELYGWGPWVNGGAWIQTPVGKSGLSL